MKALAEALLITGISMGLGWLVMKLIDQQQADQEHRRKIWKRIECEITLSRSQPYYPPPIGPERRN